MIVKQWTYGEFPEFMEDVEGAVRIPTTGDEESASYRHDVVYDTVDGHDLHLQIILPVSRNKKAVSRPCIVYVQGSGWFPQYVYGQVANTYPLVKRGYVVAIVEYRNSLIAPFPAQAIDARNAVRFMRKNAAEYGIDPASIVLGGDSSGGHTAMFGGILHNDDTADNHFPGISGDVCGLINLYGSVTAMLQDGFPTTLNHHKPDSPEGIVMGRIDLDEHPEAARRLSVECNIFPETDVPPTLIFHGTKDRTINTMQSVVLYRRLRECGKDAALYLVEGADHGGSEFWTEDMMDIWDAFCRRVMG